MLQTKYVSDRKNYLFSNKGVKILLLQKSTNHCLNPEAQYDHFGPKPKVISLTGGFYRERFSKYDV